MLSQHLRAYFEAMATAYLLLLLCAVTNAKLPLPSYIKACSRNDPEFKACVLKSARDALAHVVEGDRKYKIPPLHPLQLDYIEVDNGHGPLGLPFIARDVNIWGLKDVQFEHIDIDLEKKHFSFDILLPRLEMIMKYNTSGRILVLPVVGNGDANITLLDLHEEHDFDYTVEEKDGEKYLIPGLNKPKLNTTRLYLHLDNLFNGDKQLGETTNKALDDNWEELFKSIGPIVGEAIGRVTQTILTNMFAQVPYSDVFPE